jgi:hypothetical protein
MPCDHSDLNETALGKCTCCGQMVSFAPGNKDTRCPRCNQPQSRMQTNACDARAQRMGYIPGDGIRPTQNWG